MKIDFEGEDNYFSHKPHQQLERLDQHVRFSFFLPALVFFQYIFVQIIYCPFKQKLTWIKMFRMIQRRLVNVDDITPYPSCTSEKCQILYTFWEWILPWTGRYLSASVSSSTPLQHYCLWNSCTILNPPMMFCFLAPWNYHSISVLRVILYAIDNMHDATGAMLTVLI